MPGPSVEVVNFHRHWPCAKKTPRQWDIRQWSVLSNVFFKEIHSLCFQIISVFISSFSHLRFSSFRLAFEPRSAKSGCLHSFLQAESHGLRARRKTSLKRSTLKNAFLDQGPQRPQDPPTPQWYPGSPPPKPRGEDVSPSSFLSLFPPSFLLPFPFSFLPSFLRSYVSSTSPPQGGGSNLFIEPFLLLHTLK